MIFTMRQLSVLGICAGQGVCLYPFLKKPKTFKILGNIEPRSIFHDKGNRQWNANFEGIPLSRDLGEFNLPKKVDIIIGHPDCGDSSILRMSRAKTKGDVLSNRSVLLFLKSIKLYSPTYFLLENLPNFAKTWTNDAISLYLNEKYEIFFVQGSVSLWSNSQTSRKRLVIVGVKKSHIAQPNPIFLLRHAPYDYLKWKPAQTFELGPGEQPKIGHYREPFEKLCNLYLPEQGLRQISYGEAQKVWDKLGPNAQRWPVGGKMKNQPGVTRNVLGKPPLTVRKQNRQFGTLGLVLSPREMANIQGVPYSFNFFVDLTQRVYWLNKNRAAVTKCCVYEVARWFRDGIIKSQRVKKP